MNKMEQLFEKHDDLHENEIILDVRSHDEYAEGHVPGSINIPHEEVVDHVDQLKSYDKVYIHCKMGGRAQKAFAALTDAGLTNLFCIDDSGMHHWLEKGFPVNKK